MARVLVTADDCTGALEVAGALAERTHRPVRAVIDHQRDPLSLEPSDDGTVLVVDLGSRHVAPDEAARRIVASVERVAPDVVAHKFDSTLRGNWASELVAAGRLTGGRVLVVPALPSAGRVCRAGVVLVDGVPVEDTAAGSDPRHPVRSSRPAEHLRSAGATDVVHVATGAELAAWLDSAEPSVAVADAASADDLEQIGALWRAHGSRPMLAGTAGSVAAGLAGLVPAADQPMRPPRADAVLVVCGSLHPVARRQVAAVVSSADPADRIAVVTSPPLWPPGAPLSDAAAAVAAEEVVDRARRALAARPERVAVVLGGDTAAALLAGQVLEVLGSLAPGAPWCRAVRDGRIVVTRSGGFGSADDLGHLVALVLDADAGGEQAGGEHHGRMGR
jgi:4-hydroxythreonine-4-phosphate dehydrogenase